MPCTEWESLPRQLLSAASKVSPAEHSQAKLPRVLRQIPFLHKPGNWVHSSISTMKNHSLKYSLYTLPPPESRANGRIHTRDELSVWARVISWIIRVRQIIRTVDNTSWFENGMVSILAWTIRLTFPSCFSLNFDGFWRWIIRLRRIIRFWYENGQW